MSGTPSDVSWPESVNKETDAFAERIDSMVEIMQYAADIIRDQNKCISYLRNLVSSEKLQEADSEGSHFGRPSNDILALAGKVFDSKTIHVSSNILFILFCNNSIESIASRLGVGRKLLVDVLESVLIESMKKEADR
jgi:hypothetical protein